MNTLEWNLFALAPAAIMLIAAGLAPLQGHSDRQRWRSFMALSVLALAGALVAAAAMLLGWMPTAPVADRLPWGLVQATLVGSLMAVLVQWLGTVIGAFSARYLEGEAGQRRYVSALAAVLASVHLLLLANHWVLLIAAWAAVGMALQRLLCFYPERPFAQLAAHKKQIADRTADLLLVAAAALAWTEVGSGSFAALWAHLERHGSSAALQASAVALVLAVILRTALLPVHGWLIQVMEAPTPVSALLHAGVINLGGFVLIRFAPLLEQAALARSVLVLLGLGTAVLAGMVMLTRISIKVRLAWSTVAQMGFMLLECGLGLYTLAALHLAGHSLYKAHAFLSAASVVRETRLQALRGWAATAVASLVLAPPATFALVLLVQALAQQAAWPVWWSIVLGLAWAPLLWVPASPTAWSARLAQGAMGLVMVLLLSALALLAHLLPLGISDVPHHGLGWFAAAGMAVLYGCLALLQVRPQALTRWRRWSYAGFYVDEAYTRLALRLWPGTWAKEAHQGPAPATGPALATHPLN